MKYFLIIPILFFSICSNAQEIRMNVSVKVTEAKLADPRVFKTLENAISEFYNLTQFTEDEYEDDERIEANLQIVINEELSTTSFSADFIFQALRPVYNSNYTTQTLNHIDNSVGFVYQELQPLQNNTDVYTDNLSSILTYYAYIILGTDYDSFAPLGGEEFYEKAFTVMNNVPVKEIVQIFLPSKSQEKKKIYKIMVDINPAQANDYVPLKI